MAPLRVLVVDDEALARSNVTILLRRDPDIASITECDSGTAAIDAIRKTKPQIAFLDVQMPEVDGFDVLEMLGSEAPPAIVFVTAYDSHALRAFEAGALDYLLKPFDDARLFRALQRAKDRLAGDRETVAARGSRAAAQRFVVRNQGQALFINVTDIDWIEAAGCYCCLHVGADTHILRRTLAELERDLGADGNADCGFVRIHRSIIVNIERIHALQAQSTGDYEVVLKSKVRLRLSRRFRKKLQLRLDATLIGR